MPHATVHSSLVAEAWLAWHSMHRSMMWFLGIIFNIMVTITTEKRGDWALQVLRYLWFVFLLKNVENFQQNLQMAQLSTTMSQAQSATAFHFLTSNLEKKNKETL